MKRDGGPAFPVTTYATRGGKTLHEAAGFGMSLRDYFAAAALQGLLHNHPRSNEKAVDVCTLSYAYADAMLAERDK